MGMIGACQNSIETMRTEMGAKVQEHDQQFAKLESDTQGHDQRITKLESDVKRMSMAGPVFVSNAGPSSSVPSGSPAGTPSPCSSPTSTASTMLNRVVLVIGQKDCENLPFRRRSKDFKSPHTLSGALVPSPKSWNISGPRTNSKCSSFTRDRNTG